MPTRRIPKEVVRNIATAYQGGEGSVRECCKKHGVFGDSVHAVENQASREKWNQKREKIREEVGKQIADDLSEKAIKWVNKIRVICERRLELNEESERKYLKTLKPDEVPDPEILQRIQQHCASIDTQMRRALGIPDVSIKAQPQAVPRLVINGEELLGLDGE